MGIYVKQPLKLTHNSNMLCSSIKHDWCRYFHRGSGSCLGFLGNERGVIWSCKMIAFENGIAISHNFDRTEMESRGTNTFSEAALQWRCAFLPYETFPWVDTDSSEILQQHLLPAGLFVLMLHTRAGWWHDKLLLASFKQLPSFSLWNHRNIEK